MAFVPLGTIASFLSLGRYKYFLVFIILSEIRVLMQRRRKKTDSPDFTDPLTSSRQYIKTIHKVSISRTEQVFQHIRYCNDRISIFHNRLKRTL